VASGISVCGLIQDVEVNVVGGAVHSEIVELDDGLRDAEDLDIVEKGVDEDPEWNIPVRVASVVVTI
jgi:hypothetical protein